MTTNDKPMKSTSISSSSVDLYTFENVDENHNSTILQSMKLNIPVNFNVLLRDLKNKELLHCKQSSLQQIYLYTFENVDENHNSTILQSMKLNIPVNFNVLLRDLKNKEQLHCKQSSLQ